MASGKCGKNLTWTFDGNSTLTISGYGEMEDYGWIFGKSPWRKYDEQLKRVVIGQGVTSIGEEAFRNCEELTEITIPTSVEKIGSFAFASCEGLTEITIPNSVKAIGVSAFSFCKSLREVTIPVSVTYIGDTAFLGCDSLERIYYPAGRGFEKILSKYKNIHLIAYNMSSATQSTNTNSICGDNLTWTLNNGTLTISGTGAMEDYHWNKKTSWHEQRESITKVIIKAGVTTIGTSAFSGCFNLTSVTIPDNVTTIGEGAFWGCGRLTSVTIPDSVTTIDEGAFSSCSSLTSLTIPDSVTTISKKAFSDCRSLTSVTLSDGITTIGDSAFSGCSSLMNVTIPESVTIIDEWAFSKCTNLISVIIPSSVKTIKWAAFIGCSSLTSVIIPESVTTIGNAVFDGCNQLQKIHYPSGRGFEKVLSMGNKAQLIPYTPLPELKFIPVIKPKPKPAVKSLRWKVEGKTLTVGGVSEIKDYSREHPPWGNQLRDIQKIIIEDGVKKISANAFADCTRLEQLTISASVKTIGDGAFTFCYCGDRTINGGRNVIWSLEDGTLMIKKNPAAKNESNFSTGYETWRVVEGNITGVKIERGIVPSKNFFDWLGRMSDGVSVAF